MSDKFDNPAFQNKIIVEMACGDKRYAFTVPMPLSYGEVGTSTSLFDLSLRTLLFKDVYQVEMLKRLSA